jgi:tRNA(Leu) C34 or U34 (ribose-2'-O)-methylase TrmL
VTISEHIIIGKQKRPIGVTPAIMLSNPKFPHNVGAAVRAASCFGVPQVWFTGDRVSMELEKQERLPREERMKGYKDVKLIQYDRVFDQFKATNYTPVAVELRENAELLPNFIHPENPLYVFGPEDGSISQVHLRLCHRFVVLPTRHCVNLAAAVYMVLYDRLLKRLQNGEEDIKVMDDILAEARGPMGSKEEPLVHWG